MKASVEIRDNPETIVCAEFFQFDTDLRVKNPNAWPRELGVKLREIGVGIQHGGRLAAAFGEDATDEFTPPTAVIIGPSATRCGASGHLLPHRRKGASQNLFFNFTAMPTGHISVVPPHPAREPKQRSGGVEEYYFRRFSAHN